MKIEKLGTYKVQGSTRQPTAVVVAIEGGFAHGHFLPVDIGIDGEAVSDRWNANTGTYDESEDADPGDYDLIEYIGPTIETPKPAAPAWNIGDWVKLKADRAETYNAGYSLAPGLVFQITDGPDGGGDYWAKDIPGARYTSCCFAACALEPATPQEILEAKAGFRVGDWVRVKPGEGKRNLPVGDVRKVAKVSDNACGEYFLHFEGEGVSREGYYTTRFEKCEEPKPAPVVEEPAAPTFKAGDWVRVVSGNCYAKPGDVKKINRIDADGDLWLEGYEGIGLTRGVCINPRPGRLEPATEQEILEAQAGFRVGDWVKAKDGDAWLPAGEPFKVAKVTKGSESGWFHTRFEKCGPPAPVVKEASPQWAVGDWVKLKADREGNYREPYGLEPGQVLQITEEGGWYVWADVKCFASDALEPAEAPVVLAVEAPMMDEPEEPTELDTAEVGTQERLDLAFYIAEKLIEAGDPVESIAKNAIAITDELIGHYAAA